MALVVANSKYPTVPLTNPAVDAELVVPMLEGMGFTVTTVLDASINEFDDAISSFAKVAEDADMALFYYAGHGFALDDGLTAGNYLMATSADVTVNDVRALRRQGVALEEVIDVISRSAKTTLIFIDACRNDPAVRSGAAEGRGFYRSMGSIRRDVFVGLSTRLGDVAADGAPGAGSPFARAFIDKMSTPGLNVPFAFNEVRKAVEAETEQEQQPEAARIDLDNPGSVVLVATAPPGPDRVEVPEPVVVTVPNPPVVAPGTTETPAMSEALRVAVVAGTPDAYRGFLEVYPESGQADYVRSLLKRRITEQIRTFIIDVLMPGSLTDAAHLRRIYASRVHYYDQGLVPIDRLIEDKAAYASRFSSYSYSALEDTLTIEPAVGPESDLYLVSFDGNYTLVSAAKTSSGVFEARFAIDVSGSRPRIVLEGGDVIGELGDSEGAVAPEPIEEAVLPEPVETPEPEPRWYLAEYDHLDFWGGDIVEGGIPLGPDTNVASCQAACENNAECRIFTFNERHKICFIKRDYIFTQRHDDAMSGLYYASANPQSTPRFPVSWQMSIGGFVMDGGNIARRPASEFTECVAQCDSVEGCTAFTFGPFNGVNSCLLKSREAGSPRRINNSIISSGFRVDSEVAPDRVSEVEAVLE